METLRMKIVNNLEKMCELMEMARIYLSGIIFGGTVVKLNDREGIWKIISVMQISWSIICRKKLNKASIDVIE